MRGTGIVKRPDQRLDDAGSAVEGADIGPVFERMRQRQMPGAAGCGLVTVEPEMDRKRCGGDGIGKRKIARRVVGWIDANYNECFDVTGMEIGSRARQRFRVCLAVTGSIGAMKSTGAPSRVVDPMA